MAGTDGDPTDWLGTNEYEPLGRVVIPADALVPKYDVALVEVFPDVALRRAPGVRGHEQWPTAVADPARMAAGDLLQHSGWGAATFATDTTRQRRQSIYRGEDDGAWQALAPTTPGDSGSPVIHVDTGAAVGTLKGKRCGEDTVYVCGSHGPTVPSTVELAAAHGIEIVMRTVGARPPAAAPPSEPPSDPPPAAAAPPPSCADSDAPASGLIRHRRLRAGRLRLTGWARDAGCGGQVARVEVAFGSRRTWRIASGTTRWRLDVRVRRAGRYRVWTRAVDAAGNRETPRAVTRRARR